MKNVLITGASGAIGAATAREFARNGYTVILHYHTGQARAEALGAELGGVPVLQADLSDSQSVREMFAAVRARFGGVDVLVNNAAVCHFGLSDTVTDEEWRRVRGGVFLLEGCSGGADQGAGR